MEKPGDAHRSAVNGLCVDTNAPRESEVAYAVQRLTAFNRLDFLTPQVDNQVVEHNRPE
jgi:hypothetical protein